VSRPSIWRSIVSSNRGSRRECDRRLKAGSVMIRVRNGVDRHPNISLVAGCRRPPGTPLSARGALGVLAAALVERGEEPAGRWRILLELRGWSWVQEWARHDAARANPARTPKPTLLPEDPGRARLLDGRRRNRPMVAAGPSDVEHRVGPLLGRVGCCAGPTATTITGLRVRPATGATTAGLDQLRRNGWKGFGPVPWAHVPNPGLSCAAPRGGLHRAAAGRSGRRTRPKRTAELPGRLRPPRPPPRSGL